MITVELSVEELVVLRHTVAARAEFIAERIERSTELADDAHSRGDLESERELRGNQEYWLQRRGELAPILAKIQAAR